MRHLKYGLEELIDEVADAEVVDEESTEIPVYEETEIDAPAETDVIEEAIDQMTDVNEGLEAIAENIERYLNNGGMSRETAEMAALAVQATLGPWTPRARKMPSLESYDAAGGKMSSTGYALESIKENIKAIWDKIVAFVKKWVEKATVYWAQFSSGCDRLAANAKKLSKKAEEKKGSADKPKVELSLGEYKQLAIGDTVKDIEAGLKALTTAVEHMASDKSTMESVDAVAAAMAEADISTKEKATEHYKKLSSNASSKLTTTVNLLKSSPVKMAATGANDKFHPSSEKVTYLRSNEVFMGNAVVIAKIRVNKDNLIEEISVGLKDKGGVTFKKNAYDLPSLSGAQISKLADEIETTATAVSKAKVDMGKRKEIINKLIKEGERLAKELEGVDFESTDKTMYNHLKAAIYGITNTALSAAQPAADLERQAMASAKAAYNYAVKCYGNLKEKK